MTACRRAPKSKLAYGRSSSRSPPPLPISWPPTSSASMISAAFASPTFGLARRDSPRKCRRDFRFPVTALAWCSIHRACTFMPTVCWSRVRRDGQDRQPESLVFGSAGVSGGRVLRDPAVDDGGELFDAGHLRQQPVLLERCRLVQGIARSLKRSRRKIFRLALAQPVLLFCDPRHRGAARHRRRAVDAAARLERGRLSGDACVTAVDSLERGRNDLADLRAAGYRPARLYADPHRDQL